MANARIEWVDADSVSIRRSARHVGFDLDEIDQLPKAVSKPLLARARQRVIDQLDEAWQYERASTLSEIDGIYVVSLSDNIFVDYGNRKISPVIYIGRGRIRGRVKSHLEGPLFDFSRTLNDVKFRIFMGEAFATGRGATYMDAEFELIRYFEKTFESKPLLNKNSGTDTGRRHVWKAGWNWPLKNTRRLKNCRWTIKPHTGSKGRKWYRELPSE